MDSRQGLSAASPLPFGEGAKGRGSSSSSTSAMPSEMKVLMNHIYEYEKGVRQMVLYTFNSQYLDFAVRRLQHRHISYVVQPAGEGSVNLFFGRKECMDTIRMMVTRPLNELTPEEDFMLGALLGYDICRQCERYCQRKAVCGRGATRS